MAVRLVPRVPQPDPQLEPLREVWRLRGKSRIVTATIYRTDVGLELRVERDGELFASELERRDVDLDAVAERMRLDLLAKGWTPERP